MAHSISRPKSSSGKFTHDFSGSRFRVETQADVMTHRIERGGLVSERPVAITIGSGKIGQSFAVISGKHLFESPLSWFTHFKRWGISPGYDADVAPDFDRRIEPECLSCHSSGRVQSVEAIAAISCDRCHYPDSKHFRNPAKQASSERNEVCEACHLQGAARILHPGSAWSDVNPLFTTYVSTIPTQGLKVVSQVEQLSLSKCKGSGSEPLECRTCHNPHGPQVSIQKACTVCHPGNISARHASIRGKCVDCHMPRQATPEVAHTAYTDHRIQIPGSAPPVPVGQPRVLQPWREPPVAIRDRNLGLAYIYAGQREENADWIQKGFALLISLSTKDAECFSALGSVLLQKRRPADAVNMYGQAVRINPNVAETLHNLAVAELAAGDTSKAIGTAERAIALDPYYERSWLMLTSIYTHLGKPDMRSRTIERYLQVVPQNLTFRTLQRQPMIKPEGR